MSSKEKPILHVVVQTHWDREWYMPQQTTVARLIEVMERVVSMLERGTLKSFLFDGQTAALEDLLLNCEPKLSDRVQRMLREGKLAIGPWYVMADEFLVSGESLLRNLEIGAKDCARFGGGQRVGYLPDTFGHVGQMPRILREFDIDCAVVWRGVDCMHSEFDWIASDANANDSGARVGAIYLTQGYYQHPFNVVEWKSALDRYVEQIAPRALSKHLLLTQGGDHLMPGSRLAERIASYNGAFTIVQSSLEVATRTTLLATEGKQPAIRGPLRSNRESFVLPDVLSTRRYLKLLHQQAEDRLLYEIEPVLAIFHSDANYPHKFLEDTWRMLLQQQAHDSICGCSVDAVHAEMETRFAQIDERLDALATRAYANAGLRSLAQHEASERAAHVFADDTQFALFNPLPQTCEGWHVVSVFVKGERIASPTLTATDDSQNLLAHELLEVASACEFHSPLDDFPDRVNGYRYRFAVRIRLSGFAHISLNVIVPAKLGDKEKKENYRKVIENEFLALEILGNAELVVREKQSTKREGVVFISHELDAGDTYNFSPPKLQQLLQCKTWEVIDVNIGQQVQRMRLRASMRAPQSLSQDRSGANADTVENQFELSLTLFEKEPAIHAELRFENRACDQRTRLNFEWIDGEEHTYADSAFSVERRAVRYANYPTSPSRQEMPIAVEPSLSFVVGGGWWVAHRAMQEYEVVKHEAMRTLAITLVRSVGWMSRRDLVTRGVGAGPDMETPDAQSLGEHVFEFRFGLMPSEGAANAVALARDQARALRKPAIAIRGVVARRGPSCDLGNRNVEVSSVRRIDGRIEIRVWNATSVEQQLTIDSNEWDAVYADGRVAQHRVDIVLPHAIHTIRSRQIWSRD
jgi:mannosylglycerate hydrolase